MYSSSYDRGLGLFPDEVVAWVQTSQPKAWKQLVTRHGGETAAKQRFVKVVADAIDHRGTISVLRGRVKDSGVTAGLTTDAVREALPPGVDWISLDDTTGSSPNAPWSTSRSTRTRSR